jgi:uncharacterized protein with von Willebrand factor type A (vWA) domain
MLNVTPTADPGEMVRRRLAGFVGFLHANGYDVGGGDALRAIEASLHAGVLDREVLRWTLQALLCGRADEWRRFDHLFDAYFLPPNRRVLADAELQPAAAVGREADDAAATRHGASPDTSLDTTDFSELARADDTRAVEALMRRFARRIKRLLLRRENARAARPPRSTCRARSGAASPPAARRCAWPGPGGGASVRASCCCWT